MRSLTAQLQRVLLLAFALLLSSCANNHGLRPPLPQSDHAIDGTWIIKRAEFSGKPFAAPPGFGLKINGNAYGAGVSPYSDRGSLVFFGDELAGEPGRLDVLVEAGPNKGKRYPAIYRLLPGSSGRELEICYDLSGNDRPREFASREQTLQFRVTYARK